MISIGAISAGTKPGYYTGTTPARGRGPEDYYIDGSPGIWYGSGAESLQLRGPVREEDLARLFRGFSPADGSQLVQLQQREGKRTRQVGWDLCLSDPKSLSALWAVSEPATRKAIDRIRAEVVEKTVIPYLEEICLTRRGKGGHRIERASPFIAGFFHATSREMDPQTHVHLVIPNVGVCADGKKRTILSRPYYQHQGAIDAIYKCELSRLLEQRLGLSLKRVETWFEVSGVPASLTREWSKRSEQINEAVAGRGLSSAAAREAAARATREPKKHTVNQEALLQKWQAEARAHGLTQDRAQKLLGQAVPKQDPRRAIEEILKASVGKMNETVSHFAERDFLKVMATEAIRRGISAARVREVVRAELGGSRDIIRLGPYRGEERYATAGMLQKERELLALVDAAKGGRTPALPARAVEAALRRDAQLNDEQRAAVRALAAGGQTIGVLTGLPGTGKTRTLAAVRDAYERAGYEVLGAALAGKAARGLQAGAGIRSHTVEALLRDLDATALDNAQHHLRQVGRAALGKATCPLERVSLKPKSVLVLDEAGMLDTVTLLRVLTHARKRQCRVILAGDPDQLQPIGPGAPLRAVADRLGSATLTRITRQEKSWAVESILAIRRGDGRAALQSYAERGLLHVERDTSAAVRKLVSEWTKDGARRPHENIIIASHNARVAEINRLAQESRRQAGELGGFRVRLGRDHFYLGTPHVKLQDGSRLFEGDRVLFTRTFRDVSNGDLGTVLKIDQVHRRLTVRFDDRKRPVTVSYARRTEHMALGYAVSTHKSQGVTCDNAWILAGGRLQDREISFVQASRARHTTRFFASRLEAGPELEELSRQFSNSRAKNLAHDVLAQTEKQASVQQLHP